MMLGREPFIEEVFSNDFYDQQKYEKQLQNNKEFARLLKETLLDYRKKRNIRLTRKYLDFPEGTLIYSRMFGNQKARTLKIQYNKSPELVLKQYYCTVFSMDFAGRVRKHSKNNIRRAGPRSLEMFGAFPLDIQMIMGSPMDEKIWTQFKENNYVPDYLKDYVLDFEPSIVTREQIQNDTHLIANDEMIGNGLDDEQDIEEELKIMR